MFFPKELSSSSNVTIVVLCVLYLALYIIHGTTAGVHQVSDLKPGIWFSWQGLVVFLIGLASQYEVQSHSNPDVPASHSVSPTVSRRSAYIASVMVWIRALLALLLLAVDLTYLVIHSVKCFSLDCTVDGMAQCCAEGTLYGVALISVLLQALLSLVMLWLLVRLPWIPRYYIRDPIDIGVTGTTLHASPVIATAPTTTPIQYPPSLHALFGPPTRAFNVSYQETDSKST